MIVDNMMMDVGAGGFRLQEDSTRRTKNAGTVMIELNP